MKNRGECWELRRLHFGLSSRLMELQFYTLCLPAGSNVNRIGINGKGLPGGIRLNPAQIECPVTIQIQVSVEKVLAGEYSFEQEIIRCGWLNLIPQPVLYGLPER